MRVLWLTATPSNFGTGGSLYNGCGWISSLESEMASVVELAVAFVSEENGPVVRNGVTYYPVSDPYNRDRASRIRKLLFGNRVERFWIISSFLKVINDFKPDVIEVFGSEHLYGLVACYVRVPLVLHIQGLLGACVEKYLPEGMSGWQYYSSGGSVSSFFGKYYFVKDMKDRAKSENVILASTRNFIGRTDWDREYVKAVNPSASYFTVQEMLRGPFYENAGCWSGAGSMTVVTTISEAPYKGMDIVLRTARILRSHYGRDIEWKVFGNVNPAMYERFTGIRCSDCGVSVLGVADASAIAGELVKSAVYVHPSYVDNSPNSVSEAQLIGVPVVASNVGGIPSLVRDGETGLLADCGDPESFAAQIERLLSGNVSSEKLSENESVMAAKRHCKADIIRDLLYVYKEIR